MKLWLMTVVLALPLVAQEPAPSPAPAPAAAPLVRKLFTLKYADPDRLANLLQTFGPNQVAPSSTLHAVTVAARSDLMPAIEEAIKRLDVPPPTPQNIDMTAYFIMGGDNDAAGSPLAKELDAVVTQLKNAFPFKAYRLMDTITLRTRSGMGGQTISAPEPTGTQGAHMVQTRLDIGSASVNPDGSTIRIDKLTAEVRLPVTVGGALMIQDLNLRADVDIKEGQKVVVGRLSSGHDQALFLVLTAHVVN